MSSTSMTALIVDDEFLLRGFIAECLTLKGFKTLKAHDGLSALELARDYGGPIHLLISDVQMPGLAGTEFARILSAERPETKILIVSGETSARSVKALPASWRFLRKPFRPGDLLESVQSLLA